MTIVNPSSFQYKILDWTINGTGSAVVSAVAGSGKTSTLIMILKEMVGKVLFLAFNKKIAAEIEYKVKKLLMPNVDVSTVHAAGLRQLKKLRGNRIKVDGDKCRKIMDDIIHEDPTEQVKFVASFVLRLVTLAKDSAFGVEGQKEIDDTEAWDALANHHDLQLEDCEIDREEAISIAIRVLKESNKDLFTIDFADMIYHVLLFDVDCVKYDWVLIDEAQDTNVSRRLLAKKLLKEGGRLIAVGDEHQAIYGFSGADADALNLIKEEFNAIELPLSICYRCGKNIIAEAQKVVSHILPFENAPDGKVSSTTYDAFTDNIPSHNLTMNDGIICRNNAPLVPLAFALIRKGISCRIEGKDIGGRLAKYTFKWKDKGLANFFERFNDWIEKEIEKALEKKNNGKIAQLEDDKDTVNALVARCFELKETTVHALKNLILDMFSDSETGKVRKDVLILSSIHKSKGLEFDRVFILGYHQFLPSPYATLEWMQEQENNLSYVAVTRAKNELVFVDDVPKASQRRQAA